MEYSGVQVRKINSTINITFEFGRQMVHFRVSKLSLLECNPARPFLIIIIFVTIAFREKNGLVRNDFLDCMMELRRASKDIAQGDVQTAENENIGDTFSKLQQNVILGETGY